MKLSLGIVLMTTAFVACSSIKTSSTADSTDADVPAADVDAGAGTDAAAHAPDEEDRNEVSSRLARWLSGHFDSRDQSLKDRTYFNISLTICPVALPALGPHVLYVEQAVVGKAPYRQRLYVVEAASTSIGRSRVFEAKDAEPLVGLCASKTLPALDAKDFEEKVGCSVVLTWDGDHFAGKTPDDPKCPSDHEGATYATSDVTVTAEKLLSWDRGFDALGKQVWGATAGPYEFTRRTPLDR